MRVQDVLLILEEDLSENRERGCKLGLCLEVKHICRPTGWRADRRECAGQGPAIRRRKAEVGFRGGFPGPFLAASNCKEPALGEDREFKPRSLVALVGLLDLERKACFVIDGGWIGEYLKPCDALL